ncbi:MAG: hypothetical protein ACR5KW_03175 [Wolbachia sp.]
MLSTYSDFDRGGGFFFVWIRGLSNNIREEEERSAIAQKVT